jgi:hypothetical protein
MGAGGVMKSIGTLLMGLSLVVMAACLTLHSKTDDNKYLLWVIVMQNNIIAIGSWS